MQALSGNYLPVRSCTLSEVGNTLPAMSAPEHFRPIYHARWARFRQLMHDEGVNITEAGDRLGKTQGQVSQFGGKKPTKVIGDQIAAEIEDAFGKPSGWLDGLNPSALPTNGTSPQPQPSHIFNVTSVAEAEKWVRFEEGRRGALHPLRRAERLIALYQQVEADGGSLSPEHAEAIISSQGEVHAKPERDQAAGSGHR